jgi:adenylosuccinate lyase
MLRIIRGLRIDERAIATNLQRYGIFSAVERVLMAAVRSGADRQMMHEHLRELSLTAWDAVTSGQSNPLARLIAESAVVTNYLQPQQIAELLDITQYVGDAPARARAFADRIDARLLQG